MSVLERRVQILIAREEYRRLERAARAERRSVASVIREAIAAYLDSDAGARARALDALLDMPVDAGEGEDWNLAKRELQNAVPEYEDHR
ncbi:MAG: ribbon-helix-helix protein, CopG family [Candidatus Nanopelagicales bacterium]